MDSYNLDLSVEGSQLLDLSNVLPSDSSQSHAEDDGDLSISDLSLDQTIRAGAPFSLLSQPIQQESHLWAQGQKSGNRLADSEGQGGEGGGVRDLDDADAEVEEPKEEENEANREDARRKAAKLREEKLQGDIFILKKLNAAFEAFNEALDEAGSANQRVAAQLVETDALLNKYVRILHKSEEVSRLMFDDEWYGAEADEENIRIEQLAAEQRARDARREQALAEERRREQEEREEREREAREEKERTEREKKERQSSRGGVRGVRGTRASMRGIRVVAPPRPESSTSTRARPPVAPGQSTGIPVKRGTTTGRGLSRRT